MKDFDLEKALAGTPVVDGEGSSIEIVYDRLDGPRPLLCVVTPIDGPKFAREYTKKGERNEIGVSYERDLKLVAVKRSGWVNIADSRRVGGLRIYDSKAEAVEAHPLGAIDTIKIEWEE